ncbi:MAG: B12-binding domain-containing radical SAM protein, partial [Planctomycetes bacterium]|nr:B12-binding domain-containing radical SAM protein [Planctomycetota bacterium]
MRVLFVNPVPPESRKVYTGYNHGIGYLSAVAKRRGYETALLTISGRETDFVKRVVRSAPDVVAITATSPQWPLAARAAGELRLALPDVPVVAGGVHSTVATEEVISTPGIWAAARGEGEEAFAEILSGFEFGEWEETPGFWTRPQVISGFGPTPIVRDGRPEAVGEIVRNRARELVDLASLPHPDRDIYDYPQILHRNRHNVGAEFMASRGCPYQCSYCINPVLTELTGGAWKRVRYREPGDVVDEIESVLARYDGIRMVGFHDDIFGLDKAWLREFAGEYRGRVALPFWCNQRAGTFSEDDVEVLKEAGCFRVHMGIESADDHLRREVLGRDISAETIEDAFALCKRYGLKTVAFNMIGIPYETEDTIRATIDLNRRIRPDWMVVSIFSPFPGTRLAEVARREGWLSGALPA